MLNLDSVAYTKPLDICNLTSHLLLKGRFIVTTSSLAHVPNENRTFERLALVGRQIDDTK